MTAPTVLRPTADEMGRAAALAAELGRTPTSNEVVKTLKVGRDMARKILDGLDHSTPDCPGLVEQSTPDSYPVQLVIGMDGEIEEAATEADTDPTQSGDRPVAVHPSPADQSTTVHAAPAGVDIPDPRTADRPLSLVRDGGLAAVRPGRVAQSTPTAGDDETSQAARDDTDTDRAQSTYSPVAGLVECDAVHPQSTPVVDEPAAGLKATDDTTTGLNHSTPNRLVRWLRIGLFVIALPAFVATWSGWVGVGELTGFGPVNLLPGFGGGLTVNSAITLPLGVEAYVALAMGAWLSGVPMAAGARRFAMTSSLISLSLGMGAQVAYHLIVAGGAAHSAPWGVTVVVSCLPNLVMGMAAALIHLLRKGETK